MEARSLAKVRRKAMNRLKQRRQEQLRQLKNLNVEEAEIISIEEDENNERIPSESQLRKIESGLKERGEGSS